MFSPYWDAAPTSPSIPAILDEMWADFSDFAEATWSDEADADEQEDPWPQGDIFAEDAAMEGHLFGWDA